MALAEVLGGTYLTTGTLTSISGSLPDTTGKTYVFVLDTQPMADGDQILIEIRTIVRAAGTARAAYRAYYANAQATAATTDGELIKYSPPIPANVSIDVFMEGLAGTNRTYTWALLSLD
jgi:hypothetical protein